MNSESSEGLDRSWGRVVTSVLVFWIAYVAIALAVGFGTSINIGSEVWQLTAWGFVTSGILLVISRVLMRFESEPAAYLDLALRASSLPRFAAGVLLGVASFGIHALVISTFAGPIRFERVPEVGMLAVCVYFARFLATSCMEELGFRGYPLRRLTE